MISSAWWLRQCLMGPHIWGPGRSGVTAAGMRFALSMGAAWACARGEVVGGAAWVMGTWAASASVTAVAREVVILTQCQLTVL